VEFNKKVLRSINKMPSPQKQIFRNPLIWLTQLCVDFACR